MMKQRLKSLLVPALLVLGLLGMAAGCSGDDSDQLPGSPQVGGTCGNRILDPGETCDPTSPSVCPASCDDGNSCTEDTSTGSALSCNLACQHKAVTTCTSGDGCCPSGCLAVFDTDCRAPVCGNGVVDTGEVCDGNCPTACNDNNACTADVLSGSASQCSARCTSSPIAACQGGDGCCPSGCTTATDSDCGASTCGNGVVDSGELCDGNCPTACNDNNACTADVLSGGASQCDAQCTSTPITACQGSDGCCPSGCTTDTDSDCGASTCGNGVVDTGEVCDGNCPTACNDNDACTADVLSGSASQCDAQCTSTPITACQGGDGCCPSGCTSDTDNDCRPSGPQNGSACAQDSECASKLCLAEDSVGWMSGYCSQECRNDTDCTAGGHCGYKNQGYGLCVADCVSDADCRSPGYACFDADAAGTSECAGIASGTGQPGAACTGLRDCEGGQRGTCLIDASLTGGYCSMSCSTQDLCPEGSHCAFVASEGPSAGQGFCLPDCTADSDCRSEGYACYDWDGSSPVECAPSATGTGALGAPCATYADCAGGPNGFCYGNSQWPDGYCMTDCSPGTPSAGSCVGGDCIPVDQSTSYCLDACAAPADCRAGYTCINIGGTATLECYPN